LQEEHNYTYVHAFDDEKNNRRTGTIGLEIAETLPGASIIVVPIGGAASFGNRHRHTKSFAERSRYRRTGGSRRAGQRVAQSRKAGWRRNGSNHRRRHRGQTSGALTLPIIKEFVDEVVEVSEEENRRAIHWCVQNNRLVVEGAGAAGLAALLAKKVKVDSDDTVCAVLCGGNIDPNLLPEFWNKFSFGKVATLCSNFSFSIARECSRACSNTSPKPART
jgi:threonine dehydratase